MKAEYDFSNARRGAVIEPAGKTRITIFIDDDILAAFRTRAEQEGNGYQTLINTALRAAIQPDAAPVTMETLRRVLREELQTA
ncbi:MAG: BrnA antitoxin family protein [Candidatus Contendobacter sp.]|nr:BrnA antitoxin family protein [Candidatus Contendobacter sp.]